MWRRLSVDLLWLGLIEDLGLGRGSLSARGAVDDLGLGLAVVLLRLWLPVDLKIRMKT